MAEQDKPIEHTIEFPDGHVQKFIGPPDMSFDDKVLRAVQERAISSGKIPTEWFAGRNKHLLTKEKGTVAAAIPAAALAATTLGAPAAALTAATATAPLIATWIKYAEEHLTGEDTPKPTLTNQGVDVAKGAAMAFGPGAVSSVAGAGGKMVGGLLARLPGAKPAIAAATSDILAPLLVKLEAVTPDKLAATAREAYQYFTNNAARVGMGITADEAAYTKQLVEKGMNRQTAARIMSGGKPEMVKRYLEILKQPKAEFTGIN